MMKEPQSETVLQQSPNVQYVMNYEQYKAYSIAILNGITEDYQGKICKNKYLDRQEKPGKLATASVKVDLLVLIDNIKLIEYGYGFVLVNNRDVDQNYEGCRYINNYRHNIENLFQRQSLCLPVNVIFDKIVIGEHQYA